MLPTILHAVAAEPVTSFQRERRIKSSGEDIYLPVWSTVSQGYSKQQGTSLDNLSHQAYESACGASYGGQPVADQLFQDGRDLAPQRMKERNHSKSPFFLQYLR